MKKMVLLISLFAMGCASTHPGHAGKRLQGETDALMVSAETVKEYSDRSNIFLDFTIENKGNRWLRIDQVELEFPNQSGAIHNVIVGDDLRVWAESYANKARRDDHNASLGAVGAVAAGLMVAVLGSRSSNGGYATLGLATASVGAGFDVKRQIRKGQMSVQNSELVPENYILAPMTVPSQGFLRRWVLVNIPNELIAKNAILTLKTIEGEVLKYEVPIVF